MIIKEIWFERYELIIDFSDVLTIVMPITNKSGRVYYLLKDETINVTDFLKFLS